MLKILHYVHWRVANIHWELPENLNISGLKRVRAMGDFRVYR